MAQNKDLFADAQTLLEENLSEKKSVESARRLWFAGSSCDQSLCLRILKTVAMLTILFFNSTKARQILPLFIQFDSIRLKYVV